ncbi:hypothetical protein [Streptomyces catenulae]|uniref:Uncharacterized protein n=1 Tax=Streptomyces catenulae TaxID=66875 RepID=A0ABV2YRY0_9ACTN|nr:hypothetical protein [Streptomyces catenulae]
MTGTLLLELTCRIDRAEDFVRSARAWLTEARAEIFPGYEAGLAAEPAARGPDEKDHRAPWGPPYGVSAQLLVQRSGAMRQSRYTRRSWQRLLNSLAVTPPVTCVLLMHQLDAHGRPVEDDVAVTLEFQRLPDRPEWVRFGAQAPPALIPWRDSGAVQQRWLDHLAVWTERLNATYGHLSDDADADFGTALERTLNLFAEDTVPESERTLRGYSWATVCSADVAAKVGGARTLRASGAFHGVTELSGGRLLLRATPLLEQYTGDAPARVLRALAPVLPPGRTGRACLKPGMRLAPDGDPADHL